MWRRDECYARQATKEPTINQTRNTSADIVVNINKVHEKLWIPGSWNFLNRWVFKMGLKQLEKQEGGGGGWILDDGTRDERGLSAKFLSFDTWHCEKSTLADRRNQLGWSGDSETTRGYSISRKGVVDRASDNWNTPIKQSCRSLGRETESMISWLT